MNAESLPDQSQPDLRSKLLEAAIGLFAEKGYGNTSVREIVGEVGVTKPVLYYYFESKEGLFHAIVEHAEQREANLLAEALESDADFVERLAMLYEKMHQGIVENGDLFKLLHSEFWMPLTGSPKFDRNRSRTLLVDAVKVIFQEAYRRGEVIEADEDAVGYLFMSLLGLAFVQQLSPFEEMPADMPQRVLRLALQGLQKRNRD